MVEYNESIPLYRQVAEKLEEMIARGTFPDSKLPTERELSSLYRVSAITIKQSLNILANKGLIYRRPRLGTFIRKTDTASQAPQAPERPSTLRWLKFHDLNYPVAATIDNSIKRRFEIEHPTWTLDIRRIDALDHLAESHREVIESADIYTLTTPVLKGFLAERRLAPLRAHLGSGVSDHYFNPALAPAILKREIFALPRCLNTTALFCNKSLFEENGAALPDGNCSWVQLAAMLSALPPKRNGSALRPFAYVTYAARFWENFIWQKGGDIFDEDGRLCLINSDVCVDGIQEAVDFLHAIGVTRVVDISRNPSEFFNKSAGADLAAFIGSPRFHTLLGKTPSDEWRTVPLPTSGRKVSGAEVFHIGVNKTSTHLGEALSAIRLICDDFGQELLGASKTSLPASAAHAGTHFGEVGGRLDMRGFLEAARRDIHLVEDWHHDNLKFHLLQENFRQCVATPRKCGEICRNTAKLVNACGTTAIDSQVFKAPDVGPMSNHRDEEAV